MVCMQLLLAVVREICDTLYIKDNVSLGLGA